MRVMQIVGGRHLNGAIRHCHEVTCGLVEAGHDVALVHAAGAWVAGENTPGEVVRIPSTFARSRTELARVAAEARRLRIDVINSHTTSAHIFGMLLARAYGYRNVATCHEMHLQPHWWLHDRVIVASERVARFQRRWNRVPASRIDVVPNFVAETRMGSTASAEEVRAGLGVSPGAFLVTVVGEVSWRKSQHRLVRVLPRLLAAGVDVHLLLAGPVRADYRPRIEREILRQGLAGRVTLAGRRSDVEAILTASDCSCLPSRSEVMPLGILESLACGVPVVATDVGGVRECVRHGIDGFVVPVNRDRPLAAAILALALDPHLRRRMADAARIAARTRFSTEACLPAILASYRRALPADRTAAMPSTGSTASASPRSMTALGMP
jgi:glycosyltransferase involved in cell wall biosynthesis